MTNLATILAINSFAWSYDLDQSFEDYKKLLDQTPLLLDSELGEATKGVMERSLIAHNARDTDASIAELGEDYAWIRVSEKGAKEFAKGREIARELTRNLYEGGAMDNYLGVDAQPLAIVGNIGIQLEIEGFQNEDGSTRMMNTLSIYEIKDGKITAADFITPTAMFLDDIEEFIRTGGEQLLSTNQTENIELQFEMIARAYDPCISCSAHLVEVVYK